MVSYSYNCKIEFDSLLKSTQFNKKFFEENQDDMKRVFKKIYIINLLKNRVELSKVLDEEFNMTFSLLLEASYSLYIGQCRGSLLLLRSSLESALQFVTRKERKWIIDTFGNRKEFDKLDYRFVETKKKLENDISSYLPREEYKDYYLTIERAVSYYKKLCEVVHSTKTAIPIQISSYYSNLEENTLIDKKKFFELFINSLDVLFTLIYFLLRENFKKWDTYDLINILKITYRDKKLEKYLSYMKNKVF
ncbi:hypothetical protein [Enterococcus sp. DIV0996a]|uniref:hypothetical protein n=1 Tax=Enterococcus sp. DIV0996a TaxID=2774790 RepID=UPI003F27F27D